LVVPSFKNQNKKRTVLLLFSLKNYSNDSLTCSRSPTATNRYMSIQKSITPQPSNLASGLSYP